MPRHITSVGSPASSRPDGVYRLVSASMIFFLFSFKITVFRIGEGGIRLDDILLVPAAGLVLYSFGLAGTRVNRIYLAYIAFSAFCLVSSAVASLSGRVELAYSALFVARLIQYSVFYFLGHFLARRQFPLGLLLKCYTIFLAVIIPLQYLGWVPVPGDFGTTRASGNTNGPYELAAVASFMFFYFLSRFDAYRVFCLLSLLILYLTASRTTIAAVLLVLAVIAFRRASATRRLFLVSGLTLALAATLAVGAFTSSEQEHSAGRSDVLSRLTAVDITALADLLAESYRSSPTYQSSAEYIDGTYIAALEDFSDSAGQVDVSAAIRLTRWASLIKSSLATFETSVFGLGPSFGSIAIDGYLVRLLVETGFLGLTFFCVFSYMSYRWARSNAPWLANYLAVLLFTSFFIDIFMSYKPMMLFWFALGFVQSKNTAKP